MSPNVALTLVVRAKNWVEEMSDMAAPPITEAMDPAEAIAAAPAPPILESVETTTELETAHAIGQIQIQIPDLKFSKTDLETADAMVIATMVVKAVFASIWVDVRLRVLENQVTSKE